MEHKPLVVAPRARLQMRLSDGRSLAWSEWGPDDGLPVLFCTGAGLSGVLGFGADALARLHLKLIALDRPGLGGSDPHASKSLASWRDDVGEFVRSQGEGPMVAVAFSQGSVFAFALASAGLVAAVAIVSGQDELRHPLVRPLLHPQVEEMLAWVDRDPAGFESHFAAVANADTMRELIIGMSDSQDRALYEHEAFEPMLRLALAEGFSQGAAGYARDLRNALAPWPFALEELSVPVDLWYGRRDTSPVHSPDFGKAIASRLPKVTRTVEDGEGGSLLWTNSEAILEALRRHVTAR